MTNMYLVLIETSGNQNYIFSTNKLKENIGASELTYQAGTHWVVSAVAEENKEVLFKDWQNPEKLREMLRENHAPIDDPSRVAEIIIAASGKALVLTKTENIAYNIISKVTKTALKEAPGLDVSGVHVEIQNWKEKGSLARAIRQVHKEFEKARSRRPSSENRFLRLPIIANCIISGLPASELEEVIADEKAKAISCVSAIKRSRNVAHQVVERLQSIAQDAKLVKDINKLEKLFDEMSWLAIIHADGNGLGQIFLDFEKYIGNQDNRNYINKYRKFSLALDECTENAFREALKVLPSDKVNLPIVPLIVGGDDLTLVCHGEYALEFARVFLEQFEKATQVHLDISSIANQVFGVGKLSACAGVAIVKRHFPFSVAYSLAENLSKSAKDVKKKVTCEEKIAQHTPFPCSAIDFHILYDTSGIELDDIRRRLQVEPKTQLYNRPYVVSHDLGKAQEKGRKWAEDHAWKLLSDRVDWLNSNESSQIGKAPISSAQSHAIRTALFLGKASADAQYQLIRQRYDLDKFAESTEKDSLLHKNFEDDYVTSFLDALDAKNFLKRQENESNQNQTEVMK